MWSIPPMGWEDRHQTRMVGRGMMPLFILKEQAMSLQAWSQFLWSVSDWCFNTYDRLQQVENARSVSAPQRIPQENNLSTLGSFGHAFMGRPAHNLNFVSLVDQVARALGYQADHDDAYPNFCAIRIPFNGQNYSLCLSLEGIEVGLSMDSHVHPANCAPNIAAFFSRRNQQLSWGLWRQFPDHFAVVSFMKVHDVHHLPEVISAMAGEVTAFDRMCQQYGYGQ
jgi:hypothetical protein